VKLEKQRTHKRLGEWKKKNTQELGVRLVKLPKAQRGYQASL